MIVPRFTQDRCVILSDSGVESLLACAMANEQQQISGKDTVGTSILLPGWWEWSQEIDLMISAVDPAIVQQASVYALDVFPNQSVYPPDDQRLLNESPIGSIQSRMLLEAAQIAMRAGIRKVVWPIRIMRPETMLAPDQTTDIFVDEIGAAIDRALLAARLASLDAGEDTAVDVVIETPFVDLSNAQIAELAADLAVPLETCWWNHAPTLPNAQERMDFYRSGSRRSPAQIEHKQPTQTPVN